MCTFYLSIICCSCEVVATTEYVAFISNTVLTSGYFRARATSCAVEIQIFTEFLKGHLSFLSFTLYSINTLLFTTSNLLFFLPFTTFNLLFLVLLFTISNLLLFLPFTTFNLILHVPYTVFVLLYTTSSLHVLLFILFFLYLLLS